MIKGVISFDIFYYY